MKKVLNILLLFIFTISSSQDDFNRFKKTSPNNSELSGKIFGFVKESNNNQSLAFANVSLFKEDELQNKQLINGTITDEKGYFIFENITTGNYLIEISYAGYDIKNITCSITGKKLNKNLKNITLENNSYLLDGVELSTDAPIYENKIEKIVYNVENDLSQSANDGIDVLRNAPLVSIGMDDKVSIRGSQNVKFLLNGKSSSFLNHDNISDVLQSIPAEQIKSIEVITSPSAKYDAEGDAGVINIITNQKRIEGFNANLNTSTGTRVNRTSFNLNAGENRFGVSVSAGARYGWPRSGNTYFSNSLYNSTNNLLRFQERDGGFTGNWVGFRGSVDLYYDFNQYNSITSNVQIGGHQKSHEGETNGNGSFDFNYNPDFFDIYPEGVYEYSVDETSKNNDTEYEYTVNYIKNFLNNKERELMISFQYGGHIHDDNKEIIQTGYEDNKVDNKMFGQGHEWTGQIDYTQPLNDNKLEVGLKRINRYTKNDYKTLVNNSSLNWLNNDSLSNVFNYTQLVSAAYLSLTLNLMNDFGVIVGSRYEHTKILGEYDSLYEKFDNSYNSFVPSIIVSKKLNMFQNLKFSYVNRIQRPDIHKVNTNTNIDDLNNISIGNPKLTPANVHQFELAYSSFKPGFMTNLSLYYKEKKNIIEAYTVIREDGVNETNYFNTGDNSSIGVNFFGSFKIKKFLTIRSSFDVYTYNMETSFNNIPLQRKSINYNYMVNANLLLGKGYKFDSRIFFRSPRQSIQGERPSFSMMSFGLKKEFNNQRGSIGIGIIDPFSKYKSFNTSISGVDADGYTFNTTDDYKIAFRSINLTFKYKFGKINFDPIKKKARLENNDTLDEEQENY